MQAYHYLGALPKIGNTLWYVATQEDEWLALLSFSAAALKCGARDHWIGWDFRLQYDRLNLIANNSRFLILPHCHHRNLASRVLSLCQRRIQADWVARFGFPVLVLETFVDPTRFVGTIYRAANWRYVGDTRGYRRTRDGYSKTAQTPKRVFVQPLQRNARALLSHPQLNDRYQTGSTENETERRTHAIAARVFPPNHRPSPCSGPTSPTACRVGHRHRGGAVRCTRLPSHFRLGAGAEPQGTGAVSLPIPQWTLLCTEQEHPA